MTAAFSALPDAQGVHVYVAAAREPHGLLNGLGRALHVALLHQEPAHVVVELGPGLELYCPLVVALGHREVLRLKIDIAEREVGLGLLGVYDLRALVLAERKLVLALTLVYGPEPHVLVERERVRLHHLYHSASSSWKLYAFSCSVPEWASTAPSLSLTPTATI